MATTNIPNVWTVTPLSGGVNGVTGRGPTWNVLVDGAWTVGDKFAFEIVLPAQTYDFGTGRMTGVVPVSAITLYDRVHLVAGTYWAGSNNGDATAWEQQAPGAFKIQIANQSQQPETLLALSPFQGQMALFSRHTTQIWSINADSTLIAQKQVLSNIGVVAPNSVQSLGDLDVMFPSDSGIRSLRVQSINLNGYISDIGSPIDSLVKAAIQGQTNSQLQGIVATVDPIGNRYMIYFPSVGTYGTFYVLSYYPASKIIAWASYLPTIPTFNFTISGLRVWNSFVYFRGTTTTKFPFGNKAFIGVYGDPLNTAQYDATQAVVVTPWFDLKKSAQVKTATELDWVIIGQWQFSGSMDFNGVTNGGGLQQITGNVNPTNNTAASFQTGSIDWTDEGYGAQLKAVSTAAGTGQVAPTLSSLVLHYEPGDEK